MGAIDIKYTLKKKKNGDFFEFFCAPNNIKRTRRRTQKLLLNAFLSKEAFFFGVVVCFARVSFFCLFLSLFLSHQNSPQVGKDDDDDDQNVWSLRIILLTCQERVPRFEKKRPLLLFGQNGTQKKRTIKTRGTKYVRRKNHQSHSLALETSKSSFRRRRQRSARSWGEGSSLSDEETFSFFTGTLCFRRRSGRSWRRRTIIIRPSSSGGSSTKTLIMITSKRRRPHRRRAGRAGRAQEGTGSGAMRAMCRALC